MADNAPRIPFRLEWRDFLRFVAHPRVAPRLPGRPLDDGRRADWLPHVSLVRLVQWAAVLWAINLFFLGPLAVAAAGAGGAVHRINLDDLPWLQALLWAPVVEELTFRYALRQPGRAVWLVPASVVALLSGPRGFSSALVAGIVLACWLPDLKKYARTHAPLAWRRRRRYLRVFPWITHASCILFAAVHLNNFAMHQTPLWLMPVLVLPQWLTGLALAWIRVRRGIGASMLLHGIFNAGPLVVVWLILQWVSASL